jgi:hypothetical protein
MKVCTESPASVSRSSNVGSIIVSPGHQLCRSFFRLLSTITLERQMVNGKWETENGKRKVGNGKWKVENGKWKMESGKW